MEDIPDLGLPNLLRILRARLWTGLLGAALVFAALAWLIFSLRPAYTAQAVVLLAPMTEELINAPDAHGAMTDPFFIRSETAIIASDELARGVIQELGLTRILEFTRGAATGAGDGSQVLNAEELALDRVLTEYRRRLEVFNDGRSKTVSIAFTASNPRLAARIANAHADAYLLEQSSRRSQSRQKSLLWLKQEVDARAREARDADAVMQQYQLQHGIVSTQNSTVVEQRLGQLSSQLVDARRQLSTQSARLDEIQSLRGGGDPSNAATLLDNEPLTDLLRSRVQAEAELASLQSRLAPSHPTLVKQRQALASINEVLDLQLRRAENEARSAQGSWQRQVDDLRRAVAAETTNKLSEDKASAALPALAAEAQVKRAVFETVLNRYQTELAEQGFSEPTAAIVSRASPPARPSFPRIPLFLVIALLASCAAGVGIALLAHLLSRSSMDLHAVADRLGTRALGAIPRFRNDAREPGEVRIRDPRLYIESVRSLRNAIFEQPTARETRVCLFTSVAPSEGKTLVAMSVARSLARSGVRVLFLEMDLRCPTAGRLARRADVMRGVGAVLEGRVPLAEVIQRDADTGLDMLFAEKAGGVSLDLLTAQAVAGLLARLRSRYDAIVIDSPPVGVICDSLTLAGVSDQTVLVVRDGETTPSEIAIAVRMLRERGATLCGMVLTDVDPRTLSLSRRTVSRYVMNAPARIALVKSA